MVRHQLQRIHIAGQNDRLHTQLRGLPGERAQHIVGLEPLFFINRDTKRLDDLADTSELGAHILRQGGAVRLVERELLMTESRRRRIESHRDIVGMDVVERLNQERGKAKNGIHHLALAGGKGLWHGMLGAVNHGVTINQHQCLAFAGYMLCHTLIHSSTSYKNRLLSSSGERRNVVPPHSVGAGTPHKDGMSKPFSSDHTFLAYWVYRCGSNASQAKFRILPFWR